MPRSIKDMGAAVLEQVLKTPGRAPTRIAALARVNYQFLYSLLDAELVTIVGRGQFNRRLNVTEKGREFLEHYRVLEQLLGGHGDVHA